MEQGRLVGFFSRLVKLPQATNKQWDPNEPFAKQQGVRGGHGAENPIALAFSMGTLDSAFQEAG